MAKVRETWAFDEGYDAYLDGESIDDNPYDWYDENAQNEEWGDGWRTAADDEEA